MKNKLFALGIASLIILLVFNSTVQAQQKKTNRIQSSLTVLSSSSQFPLESSQSFSTHYKGDGKKLRNGGVLLMIAGLSTVVGGFILVKDADGVTSYNSQTTNGTTTNTGSFSGAVGALGVIGGTVGVIGGTLMCVVGQHHVSKSKKVIALHVLPNAIAAVYRF